MKQIEKIKSKLQTAINKRDYVNIPRLRGELEMELKRKEVVSLASLLPSMTEENKKEALCKMHKCFVYSDLAYGAALDFESYLKRFDRSISVDLCRKINDVAKRFREVAREVDNMKSEEMSEDFGEMCDRIGLIADNEIYKHQGKVFKR